MSSTSAKAHACMQIKVLRMIMQAARAHWSADPVLNSTCWSSNASCNYNNHAHPQVYLYQAVSRGQHMWWSYQSMREQWLQLDGKFAIRVLIHTHAYSADHIALLDRTGASESWQTCCNWGKPEHSDKTCSDRGNLNGDVQHSWRPNEPAVFSIRARTHTIALL